MKQKKGLLFLCLLLLEYLSLLSIAQPYTPVSVGELIDKITILEIKTNVIQDPEKLANVQSEHHALLDVLDQHITSTGKLTELTIELLSTNKKLWDIEDAIREKEAKKEFDNEFIQLARAVYFTNDYRGKLKRDINLLTESCLIEEKQYTEYQ